MVARKSRGDVVSKVSSNVTGEGHHSLDVRVLYIIFRVLKTGTSNIIKGCTHPLHRLHPNLHSTF